MSIKSISVISLTLALIVFLGIKHFSGSNEYSIQNIERTPIPKMVVYEVLNPVVFSFICSEPEIFKLSKNQCEQHVKDKLTSCKDKLMKSTPDFIGSKTQLKQVLRNYSNCLAPDIVISGR